MRWKAAAQVVALVSGAALCAVAGFNIARLPVLTHAAQAASVAHPKGAAQGIAVHGWWTLQVYDNGRLVAHRQFENALQVLPGDPTGGDRALANLLTRSYSPGPWQLIVGYQGGGGFQLSSASDLAADGPLAVSQGTAQLNGHVFLKGSHTPNADVVINGVATQISECSPGTAPSSCVNYFGATIWNFTVQTLGSPLAVANGQQVQVTVDLSFS